MILASSSMSSHTIPLECCPRILPWNDIKITVDSQFVKSMFLKFGIPFADMHTSTYTSTFSSVQFSSVHLLSRVQLLVTPWTAARQASVSITNSWSLLKLMSAESVMPSNLLILCHPLFLSPPIFPRVRVFSNESTLHIRWTKYWSFSFSISPSNEHPYWPPLRWTGWISLQSKGLWRVLSNTTVQKH